MLKAFQQQGTESVQLAFKIGGKHWGDMRYCLYPMCTISWWHLKEAAIDDVWQGMPGVNCVW